MKLKFYLIVVQILLGLEAVTYDTAMMLFQIISQAEIKSRKELRDHLLSISNYDGVTGSKSFNDNGEVDKKLYLFRIEKVKFVEVENQYK